MMKLRNIHQSSVFVLSGAHVLNCGQYGKTVWIEFEENDVFKSLMQRWNNKEFI